MQNAMASEIAILLNAIYSECRKDFVCKTISASFCLIFQTVVQLSTPTEIISRTKISSGPWDFEQVISVAAIENLKYHQHGTISSFSWDWLDSTSFLLHKIQSLSLETHCFLMYDIHRTPFLIARFGHRITCVLSVKKVGN